MRTIGHEAVWNRLDRAFREDRLAHALLFAGPPGIGKATFARDFAARVLCAAAAPPCGECDRCRQVEAQTHPDVRLVGVAAGKREIGVDVARDVKRFVQMHGVGGIAKVVIVDDADRLSIAAQNALLKTLEEPPGRAILMLVTDSPGGLLPTVRSRCQRVTFRPLDDDRMRSCLRHQQLDDAEIDTLLPLAQGSPGRALQLRELRSSTDLERLLKALAGLQPGRYGPAVEFAQALGRNEQEMISRLALLEEVLQQRLTDAVRAGAQIVDDQLRAITVLSEARTLLRRRNPNRPLLAEAVALRLAKVSMHVPG